MKMKRHLLSTLLLLPMLSLSGMSQQKSSVEPGLMVYYPANHHYYQSIEVPGGISWKEAVQAATKRTYLGVRGHLATFATEEEWKFVTTSLHMEAALLGGYQDRMAPNYKEPAGGWRWVTGEPWNFTAWTENQPDNFEGKEDILTARPDGRWNDGSPEVKVIGYVVEFDTSKADPNRPANTPTQEIDQFLQKVPRRARTLRSYSATVEFSFKAHIETLQAVKANLVLAPPNQFRLEGRGENGRMLAVSDGRQLTLALTAPGERTKYLTKPLPPLKQALQEAFSLLTSAPKPPSLAGLLLGETETRLWSGAGQIAWLTEGETPAQAFRSDITVRFTGENPIGGLATMQVSLEDMHPVYSELYFRFKAYPFTVRETHTNVRLNAPVTANTFSWQPPDGAMRVDDLGEGDEVEIEFGVPARPQKP